MSQEEIISTNEGGVLTLQFNRPDKKNATTANMYQLLAEGLELANQDDSIRVVKFVGSDTTFCAGNDLKDFLENPPSSDDSSVWRFLFSLANCDKPMIAGVNGPAVGIGTTMLLHCDLVVASESAIFALPFTSLGLCPEAASSLLLPMQCGQKKATEWLMLGERFNSEQAAQFGLINASVANAGEVNEQLERWLKKLLQLPEASVSATRKLMKQEFRSEIIRRIKEEGEVFKQLLKGDAAKAAFEAFLKK